MPEYLAPGVYVEETSFRAKSIEGVGTSTAAFVGLTARGPVSAGATGVTPPLLTSATDYERYYGGVDSLTIGGAATANYLAHAASAFFANGGGRLYVARILGAGAVAAGSGPLNAAAPPAPAPAAADAIAIVARFAADPRWNSATDSVAPPDAERHPSAGPSAPETGEERARRRSAGSRPPSGPSAAAAVAVPAA